MWNSFSVFEPSEMAAGIVEIPGHEGKRIHAYYARPVGEGKTPGLVLIPHGPGWDEFTRETARRFAAHGYSVVSPNIYEDGGDGTPREARSAIREKGGPRDTQVMEDTAGALDFLRSRPDANGKVGVIGMCSAGRHTFLAACTLEGIDAAVNCWGGDVVPNPERPAGPAQDMDAWALAAELKCPLLGIFGAEDNGPSPEDNRALKERLDDAGKQFTYYEYEGAGHAFWCYDQEKYRPQQCMDAWEKTFAFLEKHLKNQED